MRTISDLAAKKLGVTEKELRERFYDSNLKAHDAFDDVRNQLSFVAGCHSILIGEGSNV